MTYINWHRNILNYEEIDNFNIVFVINTDSYYEFVNEALKYGLGDNNLYSFIDSSNSFISKNKDIPLYVLEKPILINEHNQILMIGDPFSTPEMTKLFKAICSNR